MPSLVGDRGPVLRVLGWALTRMRNVSLVLRCSAHACMTLQKQIGCFNHRVVTLVADKPKRRTIYFADYIRQLERKLPTLSYNQNLAVSNH